MGKWKWKIIVLALVAMAMTLLARETMAYYTTIGTATNVVTSGSIRFLIHERTEQGTEFPKEGVYIMPGDIVSKQVSIESDCDHPFYLRVKVVYGIDSQELPARECFKLNIDPENWALQDGWYYYRGIVEPGQRTPNVFSHVEIVGSQVDNRYIGKTLTLSVVAQAVQSENNPPLVEGDLTTVAGWPAEAGGGV